ncbi:unnamed protein product [Mesocestoides corti]|uniref:Indoleamine 2,3-dioxygenase n=1 Tax=Mesocestoides corti TaxID=53468 RepID=A0A158QT38_MESCO|nr:unnamed protein product [Mesocestoides corti]
MVIPTPPSSLLPYKKLLERSYSLLKTGELRAAVQELPTLDTSQFKTHEEKRLGHKILALLSAQYVWQDGDRNPAEILPAVIAMPLMQLSIELGCQPLLGHIDLVLSNCYPEKTQLGQRQSFFTEAFPSNEMNWVPFIERTADIELMFSDAAKIIMHIISSIRRNNVPMIVQCLDELGDVISIMREMLLLLLSKWSHGQVSKGLVYEGVPDSVLTGAEEGCLEGNTLPKKRVYLGASAGQSIILQAFDALLGITHYDGEEWRPLSVPEVCLGTKIITVVYFLNSSSLIHSPDTDKFFTTARNYMIKEHRRFIEDLQRHVKLREFVVSSDSCELKKAYNTCVEELLQFRREHIKIVEKFIIEPSCKYSANVESLKSVGTGGTGVLAHPKV